MCIRDRDVCAQATAPGRYNDPDMLVVGRLGHGWGADAHESELTPDEQYAHISDVYKRQTLRTNRTWR